jgi:hypothetical protein
MFFTWVGTILAWLGFVLGSIRIGAAVYLAYTDQAATLGRRYFGNASTGEVINESCLVILVALALGVLTDISRSARR